MIVHVSHGVADCKAKTLDATFDLPVHRMSASRAIALGFLNGDRGKYTVTDRL